MRYLFEDFVLDVEKHELRRSGELIAVEPQVFALLTHLIGQRERVVSKEELIEAIWEGRFVSDSVVSSRIKSARKALGDDGRAQQFIKTHHGTGFRFIVDATEDHSRDEPDAAAPPDDSQSRQVAPPPAADEAAEQKVEPAGPRPGDSTETWAKASPSPFLVFAAVAVVAALFLMTRYLSGPDEGAAENSTHADVTETIEPPAGATAAPAASPVGQASIAVLPFDDFSQAGDQEYFADGISEELLNLLAQVDGLRVTSRTSSFAFKGRDASAAEIATALGVNHILEGSVRKAGSTLRITAQLIDARNDLHVWSQTYDRALTAENIFAVQDEISAAIVDELQGRIDLPASNSALQTDSTEAYDAYLRGRSLIALRTEDSVNEGIAMLNRAVDIDPDFVPARTSLLDAYVLAYTYAGLSHDEAAALAAPHVERALELAPDTPVTLAARGRELAIFDSDDMAAIDYLNRAIAANPNFASAHRLLGLSHSSLAHIDDAKVAFETAQRLNPLSPVIFANLFRTNWDKGDIDKMLALGEENARLNPDSIFARRVLGGAIRESGNYAAAHRLFKDNEAEFGASRNQLAVLYYLVGLDDLADAYGAGYISAMVALKKGDKERAASFSENRYESEEAAILRWVGDIDRAYEVVLEDIGMRHFLSDETQVAVRYQTFDIFYMLILEEKNDPGAAAFRTRLSAWYDGKTPEDFRTRESFYGAAVWSMVNDNPDKALVWLDALIASGHTRPDIQFEPLFDSVRDREDFQLRFAQLEANAERHRDEIELQLSYPNPDWIEP